MHPDGVKSRIISFAQNNVAISWADEVSGEMVRLLFGAHPGSPVSGNPPGVTFSLAAGRRAGEISLSQNSSPQAVRGMPGQIAARLLDLVTYSLSDHSRGGLLFHAACLIRNGQCWLLAGPSGSGKSSLALWMALRQGFHYGSDELAYVPSGGTSAQGLFRAIYLKGDAVDLFEDDYDEEWQAVTASAETAEGVLAPPDFSGGEALVEAVPVKAIFFSAYRPGGEYTLAQLSKAEMAIELAKVLINTRNLPERGFPELVRLARTVPAYRLGYGVFDQIPAALWDTP
jgi:hypothetical protein